MKKLIKTAPGYFALYYLLLCAVQESFAQDWPVHQAITSSAYQLSAGAASFVNSDPGDLNSQPLTASPPQVNASGSPLQWLQLGSAQEDLQTYMGVPYLQTVDHYYTVKSSRTPGKIIGLTDFTEPPLYGPLLSFFYALPTVTTNSYTWAAQPGIQGPTFAFLGLSISVGTNFYNWPSARAYQYAALTNSVQSGRNADMALLFYSLGHVLDLNQDLASPDQVRDNEHIVGAYFENFGQAYYARNPQWFIPPQNYTHGWNNWQAKGFSKLLDFWDRGLFKTASTPLNQEASGTVKLGLGEWSNGNFLGERSIYNECYSSGDIHKFPFPSLKTSVSSNAPAIRQSVLLNGLVANREYLDKTGDGITFTNHSVFDYLGVTLGLNSVTHNLSASTAIERVSVSLNDSNVLQVYHNHLLPKAVEYSAGILDYFFRGTLAVTSSSLSGSTYSLQITNTSSQDMNGGTFHLFYDSQTGVRSEITSAGSFPLSNTGDLTNGGSISASFDAPANAADFVVVYQGTIGTSNGTPQDTADTNIAVAAQKFSIGPAQCPTITTEIPAMTYTGGTGIDCTNDAGFVVPAIGDSVSVSVGGDNTGWTEDIGTPVMVQGIGEFEVVNVGIDQNLGEVTSLTLQNKNIASNARPPTAVPVGTTISARYDSEATKAVYVPTVNQVFAAGDYDKIWVIDPESYTLESYFHVDNNGNDYASSGLVYAPDVDRLYWISQYGGIYVINPHTDLVVTNIAFAGSEISTYDGFYDSVNHRVGFGYINNGPESLVMISTSNNVVVTNMVVAPIQGGEILSAPAAEYSPKDNSIYVGSEVNLGINGGGAGGNNIAVFSATNFNFITELYPTFFGIRAMKCATVTGEIYGVAEHDDGSETPFYIVPNSTYTNETTTANFVAPAIGSNIVLTITNTSGMIVGQTVSIQGVAWQIAAVGGETQFTAQNLSVQPGVTIYAGASLAWGGPQLINMTLPADVDFLFYASTSLKVVFTARNDQNGATCLFDPVSKTVECTIPNDQGVGYFIGCEGPSAELFAPYFGRNFQYETEWWGMDAWH